MNHKKTITYKRLLRLLKEHLPQLMVGGLCMLVYVSCWPLLAWLAGKLVPAIGEGKTSEVLNIIFLALCIFSIQKTAQFLQDSLLAKPALAVSEGLRINLFKKLQRVKNLSLAKLSTGDITYRLTEDADRVGEVIYKTIQDTTPSILQLIAVVIYMFLVDWKLSLSTILIAPFISLLVSKFGNRVLNAAEKSQQQVSDLAALLSEALQGLPVVKAFAAEEWLQSRFNKQVKLHRNARYKTLKLIALQHPIIGLIEISGILSILAIGTLRIQTQGISSQEFASYFAAILMLIDPISHVTTNYNELKQAQASLIRLNEIEEQSEESSFERDLLTKIDISGSLKFNSVYYSYNKDNYILKDINISIKAGEIVALVGPSGAGKSTIFSLILKFIDAKEGSIFIDKYDIKSVSLNLLRKEIALVPQQNFFFSGSIYEAIKFGRDVSESEIIKAAKTANAHDFISKFHLGYKTILEERGANLSGGQLQRIAIARALLGNPSILLLDEATSALDADAEESVQKGLKQAMKGRTVIVIAHRLSTVQEVDRIIVIEEGNILETGAHKELIQKEGRYRELCEKQFIESI